MDGKAISFGPFRLEPERGLSRNGEATPLGNRARALLYALAESAGETVPKATLLDRAWPGLIVEDGNLTVQIAALRKALGERPDGGEWIVTVPRVGYRLFGPEPTGGSETDVELVPAIAVLPFRNLGGEPGEDWFADGVVAEIIGALARFRSFRMVSHSSSFVYKDRAIDARGAARELGARYVMEGSVRRAGGRLRISAQLIDGETGMLLWADQLDGDVHDIFDFQDRITESVATKLAPVISDVELERSRRERPGSLAAYDIYLQAVAHIWAGSEEDNTIAHDLLDEALAIEPDNALILANAAWVLEHRNTMGWTSTRPDDAERCLSLARRALANAKGDPRVMTSCGMALLQTGKEYAWGMEVVRAAAAANPNDVQAVSHAGIAVLHCGNLDDAAELMTRAVRLGGNGVAACLPLTGLAHLEVIRGNHEEALGWAARSMAVNPSYDCAYWMMIAANAHLGRMEEARHSLRQLQRIASGVTIARIRAGQPRKYPDRIEPVLEGLRLAGMAET
ncbi:MAG: winged helix-turn-helix domain-containing tetratricopeptide repeat protein [Rhizobiaceae bacterium]